MSIFFLHPPYPSRLLLLSQLHFIHRQTRRKLIQKCLGVEQAPLSNISNGSGAGKSSKAMQQQTENLLKRRVHIA